jgi:hypothetical protein
MRAPLLAALVTLHPALVAAAEGDGERSFEFGYHGYLRAPMRVGVGKRLPEDTPGYDVSIQGKTTLHEATVPDDQYLSFQSTPHNMRSWAEALFSYGNGFAEGVLVLGSYNLTESGFNDTDANWGISQAYVRLTPELGFENLRLWAKAGAIVDRYGTSGRYDAGEYDMYVFGRTHVMGETAHLDYDLTPAWTLTFEQGFGSHKPDPNPYNNARYTLLHHEHLGLRQGRDFELGAHYLMSWSQEEYRPSGVAMGSTHAPRNGLPRGTLWVGGVEARAELGPFGYIYAAFSHVGARYALTVSRAVEVLHASGGGEFDLGIVGNYLDSPRCVVAPPIAPPPPPPAGRAPENWAPLDLDGCSDGNGHVNALHGQYELSGRNLVQGLAGGERFHGDGVDAVLKLYGLYAHARSEARDTTRVPRTGGVTALASAPQGYSVRKLKFGADLEVQALPWLSPALRFDRVMPNHHLPVQSFSILSPRVELKSAFIAHERLTLGYSRYFYARRSCVFDPLENGPDPISQHRCARPPPSPVPYDGFGSTTGQQDLGTRATGVRRPDENVVKLEATMWW